MGEDTTGVAGRLASVRERIERAASRARRRADEITLVAVTKGVSAGEIREAFAAGVQHFGESRVQEWESKAPHLADLPAHWHLVGHLQRNKAARAVSLFHTIDSLDGLPLAERLDRAAGEGRRMPVLLEVRLDPAASKSGCLPEEVPRMAEGLLLLSHLDWRGLMTVPPLLKTAEDARPAFVRLRELRDQLVQRFKCALPDLSMGMSGDFEVAIEAGATQVRVGTAIFGPRTQGKPRADKVASH
jgi:pyridoxal phosphate enzyme (YggS family)